MTLLKKNPCAANLNDLLTQYEVNSDEWKAVIAVCASAHGHKLFNMAQQQISDDISSSTCLDIIANLPDNLDKTLSVKHSVAVFNKWCEFQGLSPKHMYTLFYMLLAGRGNKKVGVYLHGQSNSGKTYITAGMFRHLRQLCGYITSDNFPFQDLGGKKIVLGEEVAITQASANAWKQLMSGQKTPVERKGKPPAFCKPDLVLLSSNVSLKHNLTSTDVKPLMNRLFCFENLMPAGFLKDISYTLNPKMFVECIPPTEDEEFDVSQGTNLPFDYVRLRESPQMTLTFDLFISEVDDVPRQSELSSPFKPQELTFTDTIEPQQMGNTCVKEQDEPEIQITGVEESSCVLVDSTPPDQMIRSGVKPTRRRSFEDSLPDTVQKMCSPTKLPRPRRLSLRNLLTQNMKPNRPQDWERKVSECLHTFYETYYGDLDNYQCEVVYYDSKDNMKYTEDYRQFWESTAFINLSFDKVLDGIDDASPCYRISHTENLKHYTEVVACLKGETLAVVYFPLMRPHNGRLMKSVTFDIQSVATMYHCNFDGHFFRFDLPTNLPNLTPCVRAHRPSTYLYGVINLYTCFLMQLHGKLEPTMFRKLQENPSGLMENDLELVSPPNQEHYEQVVDMCDGRPVKDRFKLALVKVSEKLNLFIDLYERSDNDFMVACLKFLANIFEEASN